MEKIYEQTMLYDFYGELLNDHQRSIYEDAVYNDMSLGEIAEERGISRQGVHDLIRRCDRILQDYESKLHLVERFARAKETVEKIERLTRNEHSEGLVAKADLDGQQIDTSDIPEAYVDAGTITAADMRERLQQISRLARELMKEL